MSSTSTRGDLRPERVVQFPDLGAANHERMPLVGADAVDAFADVDAVEPVAVGFVVLEADERQRANVDGLLGAVRLHDRKRRALHGCLMAWLRSESRIDRSRRRRCG